MLRLASQRESLAAERQQNPFIFLHVSSSRPWGLWVEPLLGNREAAIAVLAMQLLGGAVCSEI